MINRDEAIRMLEDRQFPQSLMQHSLASEAVMRALAKYFGEDAELWGITGLLHDLDFPETGASPEMHGIKTVEELGQMLPPEALQAIRAHNGEMNGTDPETRFDYALRCGETVTGIISAAALMRPTGYEGMDARGIKKKMKSRAFAANVNRENIYQCEQAGINLDDFLTLAIAAMAETQKS